jgi:hypothetical protein
MGGDRPREAVLAGLRNEDRYLQIGKPERVSGYFSRDSACAALLALCTCMPAAAADDYLSILEAEANDTGGLSNAATLESAGRTGKEVRSVRDHQTIRPAMGVEEFEAELGAHFSGTWLLYSKLPARQRKRVYSAYQEDNSTANVREAIIRQLSAQ